MYGVNELGGNRSYVQHGETVVGVEWKRTEGEAGQIRDVWRWWVTSCTGYSPGITWDGEDLKTPHAFNKRSQTVIRTLASFLEAHAEAGEDGENADLFPFPADLSEGYAELIRAEYGYED